MGLAAPRLMPARWARPVIDAEPGTGERQRQPEEADEQHRAERRKPDRQRQGTAQPGVTAGPGRREDDDQHRRRQTQTPHHEAKEQHRPDQEQETTPGHLAEAVLRGGSPQCLHRDHGPQADHQDAQDGWKVTRPHAERGSHLQFLTGQEKTGADRYDDQAADHISWFLYQDHCCVLPHY